MLLFLAACTPDDPPTQETGGSTPTETATTPYVGCPSTREALGADDAPLGFTAAELVAALPLPTRVAWDSAQTALGVDAAPTDVALTPLVVDEVLLVTYEAGSCEPAQQLVVKVDADLDVGDGGLVARGPVWLYAWGASPAEARVWTDEALTLTLGEPFAGAHDAWLAESGLTEERVAVHLGSAWDTLGLSVEVALSDGTETLLADLWAGRLLP